MKKQLVVFFYFLYFLSFSEIKLGLNGNFTLPYGPNNQSIGRGFGLGLNAKYMITESFAIGGLANYFLFNSPSIGINPTMYNFGGSLDYFFKQSNITPYAGIDLSYYNLSTSIVNFSQSTPNFSGIGLAPNIGLLYEFSENWATNFNFKYNHVFSQLFDRQFFTFTIGLVYTLDRSYE